MKNVMTGLLFAQVSAKKGLSSMKAKTKEFFHSETGSGEVIAMVLIVGVVLVLGLMFSTQIKEFFTNLWDSLVGSGGDINYGSK